MSPESQPTIDAPRRLGTPMPGEVRFARMSGLSIAAPDALGWIMDFLNAAYFARPRGERDVDDLRLAFTVLTTVWARSARSPRPAQRRPTRRGTPIRP